MGLSIGQRVQLKSSYTGYFKDMIGYELTVIRVFKPDLRSGEPEKICVAEIEEIHLLMSNNFEVINEKEL